MRTMEQQQQGRHNKRKMIRGVAVLILCVISIFSVDNFLQSAESDDRPIGRRFLLVESLITMSPWAYRNLVDINESPNASDETAMFWHIPKSGGTTVKRVYQCMGRTLAHRFGVSPKFGHEEKDELVVFTPADKEFSLVNVDTTVKQGILRAKELGLVPSRAADLIFTMEPGFAGEQLYDENNRGRLLTLFRHPVDRVVSKFYYLAVADWERGYTPELANTSLVDWIQDPDRRPDDNLYVRKLVGKLFVQELDEQDLNLAKEILRQRAVVGLLSELKESIRRFNVVLGIDDTLERNRRCMNRFFQVSEDDEGVSKLTNSNPHPTFNKGAREYDLIAEKESFDMELYAYIEQLFNNDQKEIFDSYPVFSGNYLKPKDVDAYFPSQ
eukprot:g3775.t1 g3775   contig13:129259-130714(-)